MQTINGVSGIEVNDGSGTDPEACLCAPLDVHNGLAALEVGGEAIVGEFADSELQIFRDQVLTEVQDVCKDYVDSGATFDTCLQSVDKIPGDGSTPEVTPLTPTGEECAAELSFGTGGEPFPTDSWRDHWTLSNVITYNAWTQVYSIDLDFYSDMYENPAWLLDDSGRIFLVEGTTDTYEFVGIENTDIAYGLGLRNGDRPFELNGHALNGIGDVIDAWADLEADTEFELKVSRKVGWYWQTKTFDYKVE